MISPVTSEQYLFLDFYHIACFEKIADLSKADFLDRISPVTRSTYDIRNIKGSSILDGSYLCAGAVERLVLQWKVQRGAWIDESEGKEVESLEEFMPNLYELLQNAGSSKFKAPRSIPGMAMHEYILLITTLAPYESDGPEDTDEWNLFDTFLSKDQESWRDPHDLSKMLTMWEKYAVRRLPLIDRISNLTSLSHIINCLYFTNLGS